MFPYSSILEKIKNLNFQVLYVSNQVLQKKINFKLNYYPIKIYQKVLCNFMGIHNQYLSCTWYIFLFLTLILTSHLMKVDFHNHKQYKEYCIYCISK